MDPQQRLLLEVTYEGFENGMSILPIVSECTLTANSWYPDGKDNGQLNSLLCWLFQR